VYPFSFGLTELLRQQLLGGYTTYSSKHNFQLYLEIRLSIPNTVVVGAFARMSGLLDIEPCCEALQDYFSGEKLSANIVCARRGFEKVELFDL
jgi:Pyruvate/2-oxoacid:ferredoxin oxidoreductase gamma subunit